MGPAGASSEAARAKTPARNAPPASSRANSRRLKCWALLCVITTSVRVALVRLGELPRVRKGLTSLSAAAELPQGGAERRMQTSLLVGITRGECRKEEL